MRSYQANRGWLRGMDSNHRPSGYEPDELPLLHPACGVSAVRRVASNPSLRLRVTTKELADR